MKMSEDERQCLSESRGGSANVISIFSYCARRYCRPTTQVGSMPERREQKVVLVSAWRTSYELFVCCNPAPYLIVISLGPLIH